MKLDRLNELRIAAGSTPLKAWKAPGAKLDEAIAKLEGTAPIVTPTEGDTDTTTPVKRDRFEKPKGLTDEEYDKLKAEFEPEKKAAAKKSSSKKATKSTKKPEAPAGTFKLVDWARKNSLDPRIVRRVARAHKKEIAPLQIKGSKYLFADASRNAVAKIIRDGMASNGDKK